jgi:LAS superfamily LD-carboxypeptidase LdcB
MNELELTGRAKTHVVALESPCCALHYEAVASFLAMRDAAAAAGIVLEAASSFRDFNHQVAIWNAKWCGERPLLDRLGKALDYASLSDSERVTAILTWSAIPGGSRHHWGSDLDVIDSAAVPHGYKVQLLTEEYRAGGVFAHLSSWLDANMQRFGFFRPFRVDRGGVTPEPWHLSYAPVSLSALEQLELPVLRRAIEESGLSCKKEVLARLPEIYTRFLLSIDAPQPG